MTIANEMLKEIRSVLMKQITSHWSQNDEENMMQISRDANVYAPELSKTKGLGKRLKPRREIIIQKATRSAQVGRLCRSCQQWIFDHDFRNCPLLKSQQFFFHFSYFFGHC